MAAHSYVQNYLHLIWVIKDRFPLLKNNLKAQLTRHLNESFAEMGTPKIEMNLQPEHVHLLISLPSNIAVSTFVKNIKGASSHWINQNDFWVFNNICG